RRGWCGWSSTSSAHRVPQQAVRAAELGVGLFLLRARRAAHHLDGVISAAWPAEWGGDLPPESGRRARAAPRRPTRTRDTSVVAARAAGGPRTGFGAAPSRCHSADRGNPAAAAGRPPR